MEPSSDNSVPLPRALQDGILEQFIPVTVLCELVVAYTEPLDWWQYIPNVERRLKFAKEHGISVEFTDEWHPPIRGQMALNSVDVLFGARAVMFMAKEWKCSASRIYSRWEKEACTKTMSVAGMSFNIHYQTHRLGDEPADIRVTDDGTLAIDWYVNGARHRDGDKPAYFNSTSMAWYQHGVPHRDDGKPAIIKVDRTMEWYREGKHYSLPRTSPKIKAPTEWELTVLVEWIKCSTRFAGKHSFPPRHWCETQTPSSTRVSSADAENLLRSRLRRDAPDFWHA